MCCLTAIVVLCVLYKLWYLYNWKHNVKPEFKGKTVFITGASSGIGECLAKKFAALGAKKLILAARRVEELNRVKQEI